MRLPLGFAPKFRIAESKLKNVPTIYHSLAGSYDR
jgi:hypothetical protein